MCGDSVEDKSPAPKTRPNNHRVPTRRTPVVGSTRRLPLVLGAIGLASLLLLALTMNAGLLDRGSLRGGDEASFRGQNDDDYTLHSIPGLESANASAVSDALAQLDGATALATQTVLGSIAEGDTNLDRALGQTAGLPMVPTDYLPGAAPDLGDLGVAGYDIPHLGSFHASDLGGVGQWAPGGLPLLGRDGIILPATGNPELDGALQMLTEALGDLDSLGGGDLDSLTEGAVGDDVTGPLDDLGLPTGDLGLPTDGLGLPTDGLGLPTDGLGLGGGPTDTLEGTSHSLSPDEEGARDARAHAEALVTTATGALDTAGNGLGRVQSTQGQLVANVQAALAQAEALVANGHASLDAQAEARIREALAQGQAAIADAEASVDTYLDQIAAADAEAEAAIATALSTQTATLEALSGQLGADLEAQAQAILEASAAHEANIQAASQRALDALESTPDIDAVEAANTASAIRAEADALISEINDEADTQIAALNGASTAMQQSIDGTIAALEDAASHAAELRAQAIEQATSDALGAGAYATALAQATATSRVAQLEELLPKAHALLDVRHANHLETVANAAFAQNDAAAALVGSARDLVGRVGAQADAEVSQDIGYIQVVAQQYGDQMALDTDKREEYWADVAGLLDGQLDTVIIAGGDLLSQADAAGALVDQTRSQLSALLGSP